MQNRFTLEEVSRLVKVSVSTLTRWEQKGWIKPPARRAPRTNFRQYTEEEIAVIIAVRDGDHAVPHNPSQSSNEAQA